MLPRESRVTLAALSVAAVVGAVSLALNLDAALPYGSAVLYLIAFVGLSLLVPQLYLAWTTSGPGTRKWHLRAGLGVAGVLALTGANVDPSGRTAMQVIGVGLLVTLFLVEAVQGYYESALFEDASAE
ncbi:hypothetical protein [Halorientalis pallida]|uniref:Uncharacterized protein n=1 Tax=Halorientalis pallida TaxID=2479928 RepID=A0A498KT81_9EURY|nr:hypothetical protein [Halorientalis pallida]RXK47305.1 hypothetical protein EAF64_16110 [Halorientalis pallida]